MSQTEEHQVGQEAGVRDIWGEVEGTGFVRPRREDLRRDLAAVPSCLVGGYGEDQAGVHCRKMRRNRS